VVARKSNGLSVGTWVALFGYALIGTAITTGNAAYAGDLGDLLRESLLHPAVLATVSQSQAAQMQEEAAAGRYWGSATVAANSRRYESLRTIGNYAPGTLPLPPLADRIGQFGIAYSLPVDVFGAIHANNERARYDSEMARLVERQQTLAKLHQTAAAFLALQALGAQREALAVTRHRVDLTYQRIRKEVTLGRAAGVDLRLAESELARLTADDAALAAEFAKADASLAESTGRREFRPNAAEVTVPAWEAVDTTLTADIAKARANSARSQLKEAQRALLPAVSFDMNYAQYSASSNVRRDTWFVGVSVTLPVSVSQYKQTSAQRLSAESADRLAESASRDSARMIEELHGGYEAAVAEMAALQKEVSYRKEVVEVEEQMQRLGSQTLENFFTHERELLDARYRLAQARARAIIAWSAARIVGGSSTEDYIVRLDAK
jgi:outer membrane protein TolC